MGETCVNTSKTFPFVNTATQRDAAQQHGMRVGAVFRSAMFAALRQETRPPGAGLGDSPKLAAQPFRSRRAQDTRTVGKQTQ